MNRKNIFTSIALSLIAMFLFVGPFVVRADDPIWVIGGDSNIYNTNAGNVGIGTNAPTDILHIANVNNKGITIETNTSYAVFRLKSDERTWQFATGGSGTDTLNKGNWYLYDEGADTQPFVITGGTNDVYLGGNMSSSLSGAAFVIKQSGNVGVGVTAPAEALDVHGNVKLSGNIVSENDICIGTCQ